MLFYIKNNSCLSLITTKDKISIYKCETNPETKLHNKGDCMCFHCKHVCLHSLKHEITLDSVFESFFGYTNVTDYNNQLQLYSRIVILKPSTVVMHIISSCCCL